MEIMVVGIHVKYNTLRLKQRIEQLYDGCDSSCK